MKKFNKVLLVDDDQSMNFLSQEILKIMNAAKEIQVAEDGLDACKLLAGELRMTSGDGGHAEPGQLQKPGRLTVFSVESHEKLGSVDVGRCPLTITSSPDGALGYVAGVIDSTVHVIDLDGMSCLARLDIAKLGEPGAHGLAYIPHAR